MINETVPLHGIVISQYGQVVSCGGGVVLLRGVKRCRFLKKAKQRLFTHSAHGGHPSHQVGGDNNGIALSRIFAPRVRAPGLRRFAQQKNSTLRPNLQSRC